MPRSVCRIPGDAHPTSEEARREAAIYLADVIERTLTYQPAHIEGSGHRLYYEGVPGWFNASVFVAAVILPAREAWAQEKPIRLAARKCFFYLDRFVRSYEKMLSEGDTSVKYSLERTRPLLSELGWLVEECDAVSSDTSNSVGYIGRSVE